MQISRRTAVLALAALALALPRPAAAQPDALAERFTERLNETGGADPAEYRRLWNVMDSLVVRELGRGKDAEAVNRTLAGLPGFAGATAGDEVAIGRGVFYSELPRALPGYVVLPVRARGETLLMGVYNFGVSLPGRVSLFARRGGAWRLTGVVDAGAAVVPYLLPLADSGLAVVTLDTFTGADHQTGSARVWRVRGGTLEPLRTVGSEMKEPEASIANGRVRIAFTRHPRNLDGPNLGTRIGYVTTVSPSGASVRVATEVVTPWVDVVDQYYGLAGRTPARARALLASPALAGRLSARMPYAHDDGGDLRAGSGWVVLDIGERRYRVTSRRGAGGQWRITSVEPEASGTAN